MTLFLVIPCYNEQEVLHETSRQLKEKMNYLILAGKISDKSRIVFVDDGSKDKTWEIIEELHESDCIFPRSEAFQKQRSSERFAGRTDDR